VTDADCVAFLQWALPRLGLRWWGFRRVRKTPCKRIKRRMTALGLSDVAAYRAFVERHPAEWALLDALCRLPISRFFRDRAVFQRLGDEVLPELAARATGRGARELRCWSAGCASGEEPYSLTILWQMRVQAAFPDLRFRMLATDADRGLLERAGRACYHAGSLKELPAAWRACFVESGPWCCLREPYRAGVELLEQDIREEMPDGPFDLVLCRNLVFTYFDETLSQLILHRIAERILPGGALVIGSHESLPDGVVLPWSSCIYTRPPAEAHPPGP
jgi:chemotaxis protein methyltransferase CheR